MTAKRKNIKSKDNLCTYTFQLYVLQGSVNVKRHPRHMHSVDQKKLQGEYVCFHFSIYVSVPCDHMNISKSSFWVNLLGFSMQRYEQIAYCIFINLKGNFWL